MTWDREQVWQRNNAAVLRCDSQNLEVAERERHDVGGAAEQHKEDGGDDGQHHGRMAKREGKRAR